MVKTAFQVAALVAAVSVTAVATSQDPTKSLPDSYKVQFENDYAAVIRVHYDAGAQLPEHTHPPGTTAYVYLNDSEGVVFAHVGGSNRAVTRPPVKAGAIRIAAGQEEHHTAENTSSTASDFVRIVFKTDNAGVRNLRQRMSPADNEFTNKQMRVTRIRIAAHQTETIAAKEPSLVIEWPSGNDRWLDAGTSAPVTNHDARPLELVRIEFLTKPK
jgi:quercetin dioxygenase-like cupin family protein